MRFDTTPFIEPAMEKNILLYDVITTGESTSVPCILFRYNFFAFIEVDNKINSV